MHPIPIPLTVVVLVLIDLVSVAFLAVMYQHRDDAHIVFRGWTAIISRSLLLLLWINFTFVGDLGLVPDDALCPFYAASLLFFYSYLASVSVQCWHTYVCWSSVAVIIGAGNTRLTLLKPPGFLQYRRLLTSALFQIGLGVVLMIAFGAVSFKTVVQSGFAIVNPDRVSMEDRCSNGSDTITAVVFIVAALILAYLRWRLYSVGDRFGLGLEVAGMAASLAAVALLLVLETVVDAAASHVLQFIQALVIVSMNLVWALGVPLYVVRGKTHQHGST